MAVTLSVAMCTYNGAQYLSAQLRSIAAQTSLPDELVVCDDVSVDDTVEIIQEFAAWAPFPVRLEVNARTLGSTKNFAKAIELCRGGLIALSDQDDVWLPDKLETIRTRFQGKTTVGLVFSDAELVDEHLRPLGSSLWASIGFTGESRKQVTSGRSFDVLLPGWTVTGATMAFRSEYRTLALPIPDDIPIVHDGWIAAAIAAVAEVSAIERPLIRYRQHRRQQIGIPKAPARKRTRGIEHLRQSIRRTNSFAGVISIGDRLRARLAEHSERFDCAVALRALEARITHLRTREVLPQSRWRRLPLVCRELFARRYHLYSNGFPSAMKDLLT